MGKLSIDWATIFANADAKYTGSETSGYVSAFLTGMVAVGKLLGLNTSSLETKAQNQYNVMVNNNAVFPTTVSFVRNLPMLNTTTLHGHLSPNSGTHALAFMYELGKRYAGFSPVTDIPKASEILDGWPIEETNYYGTGAHRWYGRIDASGNGLGGYNSNNQNIGLVADVLFKALIDGSIEDTLTNLGNKPLWEYALDYLNAWKTKFPDFDSYYNDPFTGNENNYPLRYYQTVGRELLMIIDILYKIGAISDTELNSYVDWVDSIWIAHVKNIDWSTSSEYQDKKSEVSAYWLDTELMYANLKQTNTLRAPTGVTIDELVSNVNQTAEIYEIDVYGVYLINNAFGIIIKRPAIPSPGDTITIIPWNFPDGITIGGDGIQLESVTIPQSGATVRITAITKNNWRLVK